jgi:hypothetical protein
MDKIDINIIDNREGRNEQFLPLFNSMTKQNFGKMEEGKYYCIDTRLVLNQFRNNIEMLFTRIQQSSIHRGIPINMFILRKEDDKNQ